MPDKLDTRPTQAEIDADKKVVLNTSFSCPSCASGAEKYSELFNHGTCVNCGAPLEQFYATLTEKGESEIKASCLLLYSDVDNAEMAAGVNRELEQEGIKVVDVHDIIDGSKTSVVGANLAYVMDKVAAVFVIPSQHLEDNPAIATCLNNAIVGRVEGSMMIAPIYTQENVKGKVPFGLIDIIGVDWDGKANSVHAIDKDRFITYTRKLVEENASK